MLKFSQTLCSDARIDLLLRQGIVGIMTTYLEQMFISTVVRTDGEMPDGYPHDFDSMPAGEKKYVDDFAYMYPSGYSETKMLPVAMSLYAKLSDEAEYILELEEEYLMASIISDLIDDGASWKLSISDADMQTLQMDVLRGAHESDIFLSENDAMDIARSYTLPCEAWYEFCFFDSDYSLLDLENSSAISELDYQFSTCWWKEHKPEFVAAFDKT